MKRSADALVIDQKLSRMKISEPMKVLGKLGSGTYGSVYAIDTGGGQAALKVMKPRTNKSEHFGETLDSIREMYGLSTAGLLKSVVVRNDSVCFLMPIFGPCIGTAELPVWSVEQAAATLRPIAEKLAASKGLHRDIKSSNIVLPLEPQGDAVLLDFSLSTYANVAYDDAVTTLQYRPPEIIAGLDYGRPADIWSFGLVLFNVLLGFHFSTNCTEDTKFRYSVDLMNAFGWSDWKEYEECMFDLDVKLPAGRPKTGYFNFEIILENFNDAEKSKCAGDLLRGMLKTNPRERLKWAAILEHPFWQYADNSLKAFGQPVLKRLLPKEFSDVNSLLSVARVNDSIKGPNFESYGPHNLTIRERFYAIDHLIYYGKKVEALPSTIYKAFCIWVHCFGLHSSDSTRRFGTEIQDLGSCLLLALAFNEDFRVFACDKDLTWTKWAAILDSDNASAFQYETLRAMTLSKGWWPTTELSDRITACSSVLTSHEFMCLGVSQLFLCVLNTEEVANGLDTLRIVLEEVPRSIISVH